MKLTVILLLVSLLLSNGWWVYNTVDSGITKTYMDASLETSSKKIDQLVYIVNLGVVGKSSSEAFELLNLDVYGSEPFEKEGCLYAGQVCLELNEQQIVTGVDRAL